MYGNVKDAKDETVPATAVNGQADALITSDLTELAEGPAVRWIRSLQ